MGNEKLEHFNFQWPGKKAAIEAANLANSAQLFLDEKRSFEPYPNENWIIEGENLDVLKALSATHREKIKCIYIDPPYNTGKDFFVYADKFSTAKNNHRETSSETSGRNHGAWLNMMFTRLIVARDLLTNDGVIFISIDDHEVHHLRLVCDEIFGEENFAAQIVWQTATDNNKTQICVEHEYVVCYFKDKTTQGFWEIPSEKGLLIDHKYKELLKELNNEIDKVQHALRAWLKLNSAQFSGVAHYSYVDEKGVFYPGNSANTRPGGYDYDIIHPITKKVCAKPDHGYRFTKETFDKADRIGDVLWGKDEKNVPKIKKRLDTVTERLKSYYYEDNRANTAQLKSLFNGVKVFNNPKSVNFLKHIFKFVLNENDTVLDFFAGSGSTGQAVLEMNVETNKQLNFILVQMPEPTNPKSEAHKAGFMSISDITIERNKRVIEKLMENPKTTANSGLGFKVYTLGKGQ